jgi:predicted phage terminase large subunit-like protein
MNKQNREFLQQNFYAYYLYMSGFIESTNWWEKDFCNFCEDCYLNFFDNKRPIWYIEAPVQFGKSKKLRYFLSWIVGRHRNLRFNFYTGDDKLRKETSDFVQNIFKEQKYSEIFGNVLKEKGSENIDTLQLANNGQIDFRLLGSGQVGFPSHVAIIDDPYSKSEQASSVIQKETIITRFESGVISRRQSQSMILITHSRWFVDDLIGRIKADVANGRYKGLNIKGFSYPAIAIEDEEHRKIGESLFPQLRSIEFLNEQRKLITESEFEALYQQNPIIEGGNLFKLDWFGFSESMPDKFDYRFITADTAYKDKEQNDFTVFGYFGVKFVNDIKKLYLIDVIRKQIKSIDIERWVEPWIQEKISYGFRYIWIEDKGHGQYLNQSFRVKGYPIPDEEEIKETLPREKDKVERANNVIPYIDKINPNFIINSKIECINDLKAELLGFPNAIHDDIVDVIVDGLKLGLAEEDIVKMYQRAYGR